MKLLKLSVPSKYSNSSQELLRAQLWLAPHSHAISSSLLTRPTSTRCILASPMQRVLTKKLSRPRNTGFQRQTLSWVNRHRRTPQRTSPNTFRSPVTTSAKSAAKVMRSRTHRPTLSTSQVLRKTLKTDNLELKPIRADSTKTVLSQ